MYIKSKQKKIIPLIATIILIIIAMAITVSAVKCLTCGNDSGYANCTGLDVSYYASHYQFLFFNKCEYYNPSHWVNTSCCGRDIGNHLYAKAIHCSTGWCNKVEPAFPCSEVKYWDW